MDQIGRLNALHATTNTVKASNVDKAGNVPLFNTKAVDDGGFYPGLKFSPEARMAAEMEKSPFMQALNNAFGI